MRPPGRGARPLALWTVQSDIGGRPAGAAAGGSLGLAAPVPAAAAEPLLHLALGDTFSESMSMSPMDMNVDADLIVGWDWMSSHNLHHLFAAGRVSLQSGPVPLQLDLPVSARPLVRTLSVMNHGKFCLLFRQIEPVTPMPWDPATSAPSGNATQLDHAELAATEEAALQGSSGGQPLAQTGQATGSALRWQLH